MSTPRQMDGTTVPRRICPHGGTTDEFCWRVTCSNGRYGWLLLLGFAASVGAYIWLGLDLGWIRAR
jgi:hypothetical protein